MTLDDWGWPILSPEEQDAERADVARLLGYEHCWLCGGSGIMLGPPGGECPRCAPPREHCPTHGDYTPLDVLHPECHWCIADDDDWHQRTDRYHTTRRKINDE